jgi:hypothetical protein
MPYSGPDDNKLPSAVKRLSIKKRRQWVEIWNSTYDKCNQDSSGDCEGKAFKAANGVVLGETVNLLFIQLQEASDKPVEVLRTGEFVDRFGKEVTITETDLDEFITNFEAGAPGQDVPVDIQHERGEAGGWIKQLKREGNKLLAWVDWNDLGKQLVGDKVYKYLSATLDMANKVVKSVSLVNFPAVKGLKAVELSEGIFAYEQQGFFEVIQEIVTGILKREKPAELADGIPGSVTISQFLQASIHKVFTNIADNLALSGYLGDDERKALSSAIGDALETFSTKTGEAGMRMIPSPNYYPDHYFSERGDSPSEVKTMTDQEKEELRKKIREEERARVEAELSQKHQQETELREQIRQEERKAAEAELKERYERRAELTEFANQICGEDGVALSAKPEEVVEFLEALPADKVEVGKRLLKAKVVDFSERGHGGDTNNGKLKVPDHARADIISGELTLKELFDANVLPGKAEDYDLSEFNAEMKGV